MRSAKVALVTGAAAGIGAACCIRLAGSVMNTIMSEANKPRFQYPIETLLAPLPVRRQGEPEDIANACAFLASEASSYITGQTLGVNGSRVVSWIAKGDGRNHPLRHQLMHRYDAIYRPIH